MKPCFFLSPFVVSAALAFSASASESPRLFKASAAEAPVTRAHVKKTLGIEMDRARLSGPSMTIDLFGEEVLAVRKRVERREDGSISWIGHISGSPDDFVVLTARRGAFAGRIDYQGRAFEISRGRNGALAISELNLSALPDEEPLHLPDAAGDIASVAFNTSPATAADAVRQDIFVAYTDDACRAVGGDGAGSCAQIEANIVNAIADMNAAYAASGVNITMHLAGMAVTDYDESGKSISDMLSDLRRTNDGQMDELHGLRDDFKADLLALVTGSGGGFCGVAYVGASPSSAMSVTAEFCLANRTLAHEIGHNQGATHARSQAGGGVSGAYNYGYRRCRDGSVDDVGAPYFSTIMAYSCSGAARLGNFSNPEINASGAPTGIDPAVDPALGAWAARTLNESAAAIAAFREGAPTPPGPTGPSAPAAPTGLVASVEGAASVRLDWTDNADDEDSFDVQRALGAHGFTTVATLPANAAAYDDDGLDPATRYRYRVRARNGAGASGYSNIVEATTNRPPGMTKDLALRDVFQKYGAVQGAYAATHDDDGEVQRLTETGVRVIAHKASPQHGEHVWAFDALGDSGTFMAKAHVSGREGFHFHYRRPSDTTWTPMFTVDSRDPANEQRFTFPAGVSGPVFIRARDAIISFNEPADTLTIDYLAIASDIGLDRPAAPTVARPAAQPAPGRRLVAGARALRDGPTGLNSFGLRHLLIDFEPMLFATERDPSPSFSVRFPNAQTVNAPASRSDMPIRFLERGREDKDAQCDERDSLLPCADEARPGEGDPQAGARRRSPAPALMDSR